MKGKKTRFSGRTLPLWKHAGIVWVMKKTSDKDSESGVVRCPATGVPIDPATGRALPIPRAPVKPKRKIDFAAAMVAGAKAAAAKAKAKGS